MLLQREQGGASAWAGHRAGTGRDKPSTHRKLGEGRIGDMFSKGIFLELQQLHHQPSQRFIGRSICLNVLQDKKQMLVEEREAQSEGDTPALSCTGRAEFEDLGIPGKGGRGVGTGGAPSTNISQYFPMFPRLRLKPQHSLTHPPVAHAQLLRAGLQSWIKHSS